MPRDSSSTCGMQAAARRHRFLASIADDDVLALARHAADAEEEDAEERRPVLFLFRERACGSAEVCYFVEFAATGHRWVVRIPIRPCLVREGRDKVAAEVATMRLLAAQTDIPIPTLHAYSLDANHDPLSLYLIVDYVAGTQLSTINLQSLPAEQRNQLYTCLAQILIQLRRLTFSSFGSLYLAHDNELCVSNTIMTKDINTQHMQGLDPGRIQEECYGDYESRLTSAHYTEALVRSAYNGFFQEAADSVDPDMIESGLYHLDLFRQHANMWLDPRSSLQFVLSASNVEPHSIIVDETSLAITGLVHWGWSRVVPAQYFSPPLWLRGPQVADVAWKHAYDGYLSRELGDLLAAVRTEERERYGNQILSEQWERTKLDGGFLIAHALENWRDIDVVAFRYLNARYYGGTKDLGARVDRFMREDPLRTLLVADLKEKNEMMMMMMRQRAKQADQVGLGDDKSRRIADQDEQDQEGMTTVTTTRSKTMTRSSGWSTWWSMMLITTGVGYGLWRLAMASARRAPPRM